MSASWDPNGYQRHVLQTIMSMTMDSLLARGVVNVSTYISNIRTYADMLEKDSQPRRAGGEMKFVRTEEKMRDEREDKPEVMNEYYLCGRRLNDLSALSLVYVSDLPSDGGEDWGFDPNNDRALLLNRSQAAAFCQDMKLVGCKHFFASQVARFQYETYRPFRERP